MSLHEYLCIFSAYYDSPVMSPGNISGFLRVPLSSCAGEQLHPQKNRFGSSAVNIKRISFYNSVPFVSMTCLYQSKDFFFLLANVPLPSSALST